MHRENCNEIHNGPRTQVCDKGSDVSVWPAVARVSPDKAGGPRMSDEVMRKLDSRIVNLEGEVATLKDIVSLLKKTLLERVGDDD